jgi:hypothetical protein
VEQLLECALREIADGALGGAILEVGIDAAEGELLSSVVAGLLESVVVEASGSVGFSRCVRRRMSQRRVWRLGSSRMNRRFGGVRSAGGCSG